MLKGRPVTVIYGYSRTQVTFYSCTGNVMKSLSLVANQKYFLSLYHELIMQLNLAFCRQCIPHPHLHHLEVVSLITEVPVCISQQRTTQRVAVPVWFIMPAAVTIQHVPSCTGLTHNSLVVCTVLWETIPYCTMPIDSTLSLRATSYTITPTQVLMIIRVWAAWAVLPTASPLAHLHASAPVGVPPIILHMNIVEHHQMYLMLHHQITVVQMWIQASDWRMKESIHSTTHQHTIIMPPSSAVVWTMSTLLPLLLHKLTFLDRILMIQTHPMQLTRDLAHWRLVEEQDLGQAWNGTITLL
jgi:hypothetical protein